MDIVLAIILGTLFGFMLHRVGASNPENIINMLRLKDFHLMKVIFFAIAISSSLLFIAGGLILGAGWAIAGYCPGTGVAAIGDGRKDALFFVLGGLFGACLYMVLYAKLKGTFLLEKILGGKVTLALTPNESFKALTDIPGIVVALILAIALGLAAWSLPSQSS
jgi:hypothetical protein